VFKVIQQILFAPAIFVNMAVMIAGWEFFEEGAWIEKARK